MPDVGAAEVATVVFSPSIRLPRDAGGLGGLVLLETDLYILDVGRPAARESLTNPALQAIRNYF